MPPPKKAKKTPVPRRPRPKRGGSVASDAVTRAVPESAWQQMDREFTRDFPGMQGGAQPFWELLSGKDKSKSYTLNHQSLRGGDSSTTTAVAAPVTDTPVLAPANGSKIAHTGGIIEPAILNYPYMQSDTTMEAQYPTTIPDNTSFQLGGKARKRASPAKKKTKKKPTSPAKKTTKKPTSSPAKKKKRSPAKATSSLPSLRDLQRDLRKIFGPAKR